MLRICVYTMWMSSVCFFLNGKANIRKEKKRKENKWTGAHHINERKRVGGGKEGAGGKER